MALLARPSQAGCAARSRKSRHRRVVLARPVQTVDVLRRGKTCTCAPSHTNTVHSVQTAIADPSSIHRPSSKAAYELPRQRVAPCDLLARSLGRRNAPTLPEQADIDVASSPRLASISGSRQCSEARAGPASDHSPLADVSEADGGDCETRRPERLRPLGTSRRTHHRAAPELTAPHRCAHPLASGTAATVTATLTAKPSGTAAIAHPTH
jgi:hypothetical protein